jgi:hypothetical protein
MPRDPDNRFDAEPIRQGRVILRERWQRIVFAAGLVGCAVLVLLAAGYLHVIG